ncbi:hypothetical protein KCU93_g227, partial [Aureobasidium melanogenum]
MPRPTRSPSPWLALESSVKWPRGLFALFRSFHMPTADRVRGMMKWSGEKNNRGPVIGHNHVRSLAHEYTIVACMSSTTQVYDDSARCTCRYGT